MFFCIFSCLPQTQLITVIASRSSFRKILAALIESGNDLTDEAIERIIEES